MFYIWEKFVNLLKVTKYLIDRNKVTLEGFLGQYWQTKKCFTWLQIHLVLFTIFSITDMSECNGGGNNIFVKRDCVIMDW